MKCLSLLQPFASLVAAGAKRIETRSFPVRHRGPLAIHASARWERDYLDLCFEEPFRSALKAAGFATPRDIPLGCVLAICELTGCFATPSVSGGWREYWGGFRLPPDEPEASFGNYAPGRFAWRLENVLPLPEPVPAKGNRGLWEWSPGGVVAVETALPQAALELD